MRAVPLVLALFWGLNWPAVRIALEALPPFTLRAAGLSCGALVLLAIAALRGTALRIPAGMGARVVVAGLLNIAAFNIATAFAQLSTSTSRAAVLTFTMPLWTALFARLVLGERIGRRKGFALAVGTLGLVLLAWPVLSSGVGLAGLAWPLIAALGWAMGTVFLKWRPISGDPLVLTAWQLLIGAACAGLGLIVFGETPRMDRVDARVVVALAFHVLPAMAIAYVLWFRMLDQSSASSAALTTLMIPVVGVLGAMMLVGDRPVALDLAGFAAVLSAAALVLLPGTAGVRTSARPDDLPASQGGRP